MTEHFKPIAAILRKEVLALADTAPLDADPNKLLDSIKTQVKLGESQKTSVDRHGHRVISVVLEGRLDLFDHYTLPQYLFRDKPGFVYGMCKDDPKESVELANRMKATLEDALNDYNENAKKLSRGYYDALANRMRERKLEETPAETVDEALARHGITNEDSKDEG